ncbi:helix-turn-helix domain-containing protein [Nocardioides soli]|uniref:helix-turn-helix domain-containing protein n=1 Tax=Nocardioides soli TaxID=1036020 RepID=UPI00160D6815
MRHAETSGHLSTIRAPQMYSANMANIVEIEEALLVDEQEVADEVGARIHQLMWRKRITQVQLGRALGIGQSTAGKKVRGETSITIPELMKIARLLDVEPGDLLPPLEEVTLPRLDSNQQPSG